MNDLFAHPWWLYFGLAALAALGALLPWSEARRRRVLALFGELGLMEPMVPESFGYWRSIKTGVRLAALFFLLVALAGPRWGVEIVEGDDTGIHAVIAVDVSGSMLSEDVKPNRLDKALRALTSFIDEMGGNRIGIVAFSGMAAIQCPLTTDLEAARLFLHALRPDMLPMKGTAVGEAVRLATKMLSPFPGTKGLVLITDGEDHESDPLGAAKAAAEAGIRIYALGIGRPEGEPIPIRNEAGTIVGYKKDDKGNTVLSRLDEKTLAQMAQLTGGAYFRTTANETEISETVELLKHLDRSRMSSGIRERFKDRTHIPLALALALLVLELSLPLWKPQSKIDPPSLGKEVETPKASGWIGAALSILFLLLPTLAHAGIDSLLNKGTSQLEAGENDKALETFRAARQTAPEDPRPIYDEGIALYRLERFDEAASSFEQAAAKAEGPLRRDALYNQGNAHFRAKQADKAVNSYRDTVLSDQSDRDARHNLQVALKKKKDDEKNDKNKKNDPKDDKKNEKQSQDQKNSGGVSKEDAKRILESMKEKEKSNFDPAQYDRAGKTSHRNPGAATKEDW